MRRVCYEIMSAKKYYGNHATGAVLLRNNCVEFHGSRKDAKWILSRLKDQT